MPEEQHIKTDEARGGSTPGIVRYVLVISLTLIVIAMLVVLALGYRPGVNSISGGTAPPGGTQSMPTKTN